MRHAAARRDACNTVKLAINPFPVLPAAIEIEIHDGPYNIIQDWDYTGMVECLCNGKVGSAGKAV